MLLTLLLGRREGESCLHFIHVNITACKIETPSELTPHKHTIIKNIVQNIKVTPARYLISGGS